MVQVCERRRTKAQILENALEQYREVFVRARNNFARVIDVSRIWLRSSHMEDIELVCDDAGGWHIRS